MRFMLYEKYYDKCKNNLFKYKKLIFNFNQR